MQSKYAKSDRNFFENENPTTLVVGFWPKIRRSWSSDFQIENVILSEFNMLSTTANSSRMIDELDGDTTV